MTTLHAGGKFDGGGYKVSGGLHGVGVSAVNALSERMEVEVWRDGHVYQQDYERGIPKGPVEEVKALPIARQAETGTRITFRFDPTIFKEVEGYRYETLLQRLREMAFVTKGVTIRFRDERQTPAREMTFYFEGGITSFVRYINRNRGVLHPVVYVERDVSGWGDTPDRPARRPDPDHQRLRPQAKPLEGERVQLQRRGHPRGADGHRLYQAPRPAV
jgi:DNA gyrase subunit B